MLFIFYFVLLSFSALWPGHFFPLGVLFVLTTNFAASIEKAILKATTLLTLLPPFLFYGLLSLNHWPLIFRYSIPYTNGETKLPSTSTWFYYYFDFWNKQGLSFRKHLEILHPNLAAEYSLTIFVLTIVCQLLFSFINQSIEKKRLEKMEVLKRSVESQKNDACVVAKESDSDFELIDYSEIKKPIYCDLRKKNQKFPDWAIGIPKWLDVEIGKNIPVTKKNGAIESAIIGKFRGKNKNGDRFYYRYYMD